MKWRAFTGPARAPRLVKLHAYNDRQGADPGACCLLGRCLLAPGRKQPHIRPQPAPPTCLAHGVGHAAHPTIAVHPAVLWSAAGKRSGDLCLHQQPGHHRRGVLKAEQRHAVWAAAGQIRVVVCLGKSRPWGVILLLRKQARWVGRSQEAIHPPTRHRPSTRPPATRPPHPLSHQMRGPSAASGSLVGHDDWALSLAGQC